MLLHDSCIACKGIWLPHELPFGVVQDFILQLLDGYIACRGILLLHELPFGVLQDLIV